MEIIGNRPLDEKQAAAFLGLKSHRVLQAWRCRRIGPPYLKVGHAVRYKLQDLVAYLEKIRVDPNVAGSE
jgi:hypothetical protein